jgi:serine/threonine protein kinase/tetratricopeptide (TPR) repeat protein
VLSEVLGVGGFGAVYRAERRRTRADTPVLVGPVGGAPPAGIEGPEPTEVAIKVARLDQPTASARLLLEAEALRAVAPPHVPEVYETGRLASGAAFMVLEFINSPTLANELAEVRGPLFAERLHQVSLALVDLVAVTHRKGFVHCDLKPENLFVSRAREGRLTPTPSTMVSTVSTTTPPPTSASASPRSGRAGFVAKLFDFGLVRKRRTSSAEDTREEAPEGTPEYMSPEQCEGGHSVDARADVYALGVMLYEMAAGAPPFWGNAAEVQQSHRSRRPAAPSRRNPAIPEALEAVILRCLAKSPERRFADAGVLADALRAAFGQARKVEPTPPSRPGLVVAGPAADGGVAPGTGPALASVEGKAKAAVPAPARERRAVAMVFLETKSSVAAIREVIAATGGQLAHAAGSQYVVVLGHEVGDNPTRSAAQAAQLFIDKAMARNVLVDLATVAIQVRPDGSRRYQSPLFARKEQYLTDIDPAGVVVSKAVLDVLPELESTPIYARPGFGLLSRSGSAPETTTVRAGVAPLVGRGELLRALLDSARTAMRSPVGSSGRAALGRTGFGTAMGQGASAGASVGAGAGPGHTSVGLGNGTATTTTTTSAQAVQPAHQPTIVTVLGEGGTGKSHLVAALAQHLESILPPMRVLVLRAKEVLGGAGDHTTRELLRHAMELPSEAPADLGHALVEQRLGRELAREAWAAVAVVMGWVSADHPEVGGLSAAPGALRAATARAAGEALREMSRRRPLALVLEDAHFADETVLDAIEYATLEEAGCPIWVAVVARPAFGRGRTAWASRAALRASFELGPLDPSAAAELARRLLSPAENVSAEALRRLTERTKGIPLLLVELVRGLKRDGLVRRSERTGAWFLATDELERLPDLPLVQWLASRETESLPAELAGHARLASVLGAEFSADELEGVVRWLERAGITPETQLDARVGVDRLTDAGVLVRHRQGRVGFRHDLLRQTVYQAVPQAEREAIHRAAYAYYLENEGLPEDRRLPAMALHAARSGLKDEAANTYLDLAAKAERRHAYLDAELLFDNAIRNLLAGGVAQALAVEDPRPIRARRGLGIMRFRLGRYEDALKELSAAREAAHGASARASEVDLLLEESLVLDWLKDWTRAGQLVERAGELSVGLEDLLLRAKLIFARGRTLHRAEKTAAACTCFEESAALAESLGDDGYETHVLSLGLAGWAYSLSGRIAEAEKTFARLISLTESRRDMLNLTMALSNRCIVWMLSFQTPRLLEDLRRVIAIARETGFPLIECSSSKDLGEVYLCLGQDEDAEAQARQAMSVARQVVGRRSSAAVIAELLFARVLVRRGRVAEARDALAEIAALQAEARAAGEVGLEWGGGEQLLSDSVQLVIDGAPDAEWDRLLGRAREMMMQPQDVVEMMELRVLACLRMKRTGDARRFWRAALDEATRSAEIAVARLQKLEPILDVGLDADLDRGLGPEPSPIAVPQPVAEVETAPISTGGGLLV